MQALRALDKLHINVYIIIVYIIIIIIIIIIITPQ